MEKIEFNNLLETIGSNSDELTKAIKSLVKLQKNGAIDTLVEISFFLKAARESISDTVLPHTVSAISELITLLDRIFHVVGGIEGLQQFVILLEKAKSEVSDTNYKVGVGGLYKILKEPVIQKNIKIIMTLLENLDDETKDITH